MPSAARGEPLLRVRSRPASSSWPPIFFAATAPAQDLLDLLGQLGFDCYFAAMQDAPDPYGLNSGACRSTVLRFDLRAVPIPPDFVQGDLLIIHRTSLHASAVRQTGQ